MWKRPKWFLKDPAPFRRNYPICYQVPEGGSTSLETGYISRAVVYSLSFFYTILRLQHLIPLASVKCFTCVCVCVGVRGWVFNKVHLFSCEVVVSHFYPCFSKYFPLSTLQNLLFNIYANFLQNFFALTGPHNCFVCPLSEGTQTFSTLYY